MGTFADERRKRVLQEKETPAGTTPLKPAGGSFVQERIRRMNQVNMSKSTLADEKPPVQYNVRMYDQQKNLTAMAYQYAQDWAARKQREAQMANVAAEMEQRRQATDIFRADREDIAAGWVKDRYRPSSDFLWGTQKYNEAKLREHQQNMRGVMVDGRILPYTELPAQPDFAREAQKGAAMEGNYAGDILGNMERKTEGKGKWEILLDQIREISNGFKNMYNGIRYGNHNFEYMSEAEKDMYSYLYSKYGIEQADKYAQSLDEELNRRSGEAVYERTQDIKDGNKAAGVASGLLLSGAAGTNRAAQGLLHVPDAIFGNPVADATTPYEAYTEELNKNAYGVEKGAYDIANSIGFMLPSMLAAPATSARVGSAMFGAASGGSSYNDSIREGQNVEMAQTYATINAASEIVTQYALGGIAGISGGTAKKVLGNTKVAKAAAEGLAKALKNPTVRHAVFGTADYISDMTSEAAQEYTQELLDKAARNLLFDEDNKIRLTDPDAWYAALLGGVTAGLMNAPGRAAGMISRELNYNAYGKTINPDYRDYVEMFPADREGYLSDADYQEAQKLQQLARDYADRQRQGGYISNREKAKYDIRLDEYEDNIVRQMKENDAYKEAQDGQKAQENTGVEGATPEAGKGQEGHAVGLSEASGSVQENGQVDAAAQAEQEPQVRPGTQVQPEMQVAEAPEERQEVAPVQQVVQVQQVAPVQEETNTEQAEAFGSQYGVNGKRAFVDQYDGNVEVDAYNRAFGRVYDAGRYDVDLETAEHSALLSVLTPEQVQAAYKAGMQDRNAERAVSPVTGKPLYLIKRQAKAGGLGQVTEAATESQKKLASHIGELTGLQIDLVDGLGQENAQASYQKGKITLSVNSSDFLANASHELTHFIKDYSPDLYEVYQGRVTEALMKSTGTSLDKLYESYDRAYTQAGQKLSRAEIMDEIAADATEKFFNDEDFVREVVQDNQTLAERIAQFFSDVVDAIKELIHKGGTSRKAAKALEENLELYQSARTLWMAALEEGSERSRDGWEVSAEQTEAETQGNGRFKLAKPDQVTEEHIEENFETVRNMEPVAELTGNEFEKGEKRVKEQVLEFFESVGGKARNEVVGDVLLNNRAIKDDIAHGIGRIKIAAFAAVPSVIENGYVLNYSSDWKNRGYDSVVLGAKVKIGGDDYYELVVVKILEDNRLYIHEVHTVQMGEQPVLDQNRIASGTIGGNVLPSIHSIFEKLGKVNGNTEQEQKVRFQLEGADDYDMESKVESLMQENQELREANELLQKQFEQTSGDEVRQEDIGKVADKVLKKYNSTYEAEMLKKNLTSLYEYIRSADRVDGKELAEAATSLGRVILKKSQHVDTELTEKYKAFRKQIRNTKMTISEEYRADLDSVGGYETFRKKHFGTLRLGNGGIPVDSLYQELSDQHPELFDTSISHPADQLIAIAEAMDYTAGQVQNPYHANMDEMSYLVGQELLEAYFDVRQVPPTFADKRALEVERTKREYSKKMREYKESLQDRYEDNLKSVRAQAIRSIAELTDLYNKSQGVQKDYYRQKIKDLRSEKNQKLAAMQQKYKEQARSRRERQQRTQDKKIIMKDRQSLETWLLKPTDQKHIPESLRGTVAEFLKNIDFSANDDGEIMKNRTLKWIEAADAFVEIIKQEGMIAEDGKTAFLDIDPDMEKRIKEIAAKVKTVKLDDLDAYSMGELKKVVQSMKKALTEANSLKSNRKYGEVSMLSDKVFEELERRKTKTEYVGLLGTRDKLMNYDMLDAQTVFGMMGDSLKSTYDSLREGLNRKTLKLKMAQDYITEVIEKQGITEKELRQWTGVNAPSRSFSVAGGEISLNIAQIMSLYELDKRNQAKGHIYNRNGGIKHAPRVTRTRIVNGKVVPGQIEKAYSPVRVTAADVKAITDTLTPQQKALADAMQRFMGAEIAEWGNEVSMAMYGYKKFTSRNYFPIVTDKNYIATKDGDVVNQTSTIKNMGITKNTVDHASNPIIIEDIFDVFSRQVDQMSSYNAYVIPLSDLQKVYNYKDARNGKGSIKQEIERTFGADGTKYIHQLMVDINGSLNTDRSIGDKLLSNMKAASVAGNLRVAIQQPTAYVRAAMEIDPKYLLHGAVTTSRKGQWDLICKYAPIAQWKDWGFYRMETSRQMKDIMFGTDSLKNRVVNKTMVLAEKGDQIAWNRLWRACEYECMDLHPELQQGTEEFYRKVGERFGEIVDKTQVADSVLHRTQIMRSQSGMNKLATSFMAEPMKSYNMLYRAVLDARSGKPGGKRRAAKAGAVFVASNVLTAIAAGVVDALRDDDRDKEWVEKYKKAVWDNIKDSTNILNNIPYVKDAVSAINGFTPTRSDVAGFQDLVYAWNRIKKLMAGESKYTPWQVALYSAQQASKLTGLPIKSITRDAGALIDTAINAAGGEADYQWMKLQYDIRSSDNKNMYVRLMMDAQDAGNQKLADKIRADLIAAGISKEKIDDSMNDIINAEIRESLDLAGAITAYQADNKESRDYFREQVDGYIALKAEAGWDKKKCITEIRKKITNIYKPQFQNAKTQKERDDIIKKCKQYFYDGDSLYAGYDFNNFKK